MDMKAQHISPANKQAFYKEGRDWEFSRQAQIEQSERRAWWVAGGACLFAGLAVAGMMISLPLKRTIPILFEVDKATGNVEMVDAVNNRTTIGYQELLDKHWASRYITARESYFYRLLQSDYDLTLALSSGPVARDYAALFQGDAALDKRLGADSEIRVSIISISLAPDAVSPKAVVRFSKTRRNIETGVVEPVQYYVATVSYAYQPSMFGKEKDLIVNPLGYHVTAYRVDEEITPPVVPAIAPVIVPATLVSK